MKKYILFSISLSALLSSGCRPEFYEPQTVGNASPGLLKLDRYVAVGSTITSGFADNALYAEAQSFAYPVLISLQMKQAAAGLEFSQPDIQSVNGWSGGTNGKLQMVQPSCLTVSISGKATTGEGSLLPFTGDPAAVTNLAVPFLTSQHLNTASLPSGTSYNNPLPYYSRFISPASSGIAAEAAKRKPGVFTVWIGYTELLKYATSGGTASIPDVADFKARLGELLDSLLAGGGNGVVGNLPYADHFAVVTNNNRRLTSNTDPARTGIRFSQTLADQYNSALGVNLFSGANGFRNQFAIETGAGSVRAISTSSDFVVRGNVLDSVGIGPRDSLMVRDCTPNLSPRTQMGFLFPIPNNAVLDKDEVAFLRNQTDLWNRAIQELVEERNRSGLKLIIADMNNLYKNLNDVNAGLKYGAQVYRASHPSLGPDFGGFFSLDRLTPTPRGHALIANEFIKAFNGGFGSDLPLLDPSAYRGNQIPGE